MTVYSHDGLNYTSINIEKTILYLSSDYRRPNFSLSLSHPLDTS